MLTISDLKHIKAKGIKIEQIEEQLTYFKTGFPFLQIQANATLEKGIMSINEKIQSSLLNLWAAYLRENKTVVKFVPASGAASRMFKDLFEYFDSEETKIETQFLKTFFDNISSFAFYEQLQSVCMKNDNQTIEELIETGFYKNIIENLLYDHGLNYGKLPKGLLLFHRYREGERTAMEEHLVEGALYACNEAKQVRIHFTVSPEHREIFRQAVKTKVADYEQKFGVKFQIDFSEQKPSTDTVAADSDNQPFHDDGKLLFRPGGHGALIENLNDISADVVFIKNIDNVVPDAFKSTTVHYKKILGGLLIYFQLKIFTYLERLDSGKYDHAELLEMLYFLQNELCIKNPETKMLEDAELAIYIKSKLNRPLRVCGMVKNQGEPGGGPFLAVNSDGTVSPQILEKSQIDLKNPALKKLFENGTHFNPVDLVCSIRNYKGEKFDLSRYIDKNTGFISCKSKSGKKLKALELPGLWNGAMSDWNTVFVEVPVETFNPVKTVNDLLRAEHQ